MSRNLLTGAFLATVALAQSVAAMEIVAHRGASHEAPENTLAAVELAWRLGADAVEVDVYLSSDGRIVVIHDETTGRTASRNLKVAAAKASALRKLDVGAWHSKKYKGEKIPFLEEVLATVPQEKKLLIEIKCGPEIIGKLAAILHDAKKTGRVRIISFGYDVVCAAKKALPGVEVLWLKKSAKSPAGDYLQHSVDIVAKARRAGLDGVGMHHGGVVPAFAKAVKEAGLKLFVWTVDASAEARRLTGLGIDGLVTNRPGWMRRQLAEGDVE